MLTGKVPNISNMNIFGTICYPHKEGHISKLDDRCTKGIFLGYDKNSPAYIIYYPESNKILLRRCVTFTDKFVYQDTSPLSKAPLEEIAYSDDDDYFPDNVAPDEVEPEVPTPVEDVPDEVPDGVDENGLENENEMVQRYEPERRNRRQPQYLQDYVVGEAVDNEVVDFVSMHDAFENTDYCFKTDVYVPKTFKQAMTCPDAEKWKDAMDDEMNSLRENQTYEIVPLPADKHVMGGRWVYTVKVEPGGKERYKARYVAQGFKQVEGSDYTETFAPTAKMSTVRMLMQISVNEDLIVHQLDVKTAYLNAPLDTEIYMNQPLGYETAQNDCKMVCKLLKSLYGLKQSGRMRNLLFHDFLLEKGFIQSKHDHC